MRKFNVCYILSLINYNNHIQSYIDMLYKSLYSLNKYYHINNLYILISYDELNQYSDILNEIKNNLNNICYNTDDLNIIDVNINLVKLKYPINNSNKDRIDKTALLKFYIPKLVDVSNIFYFDCDIIFYGNIMHNLCKDITDKTLFKIYDTPTYGVNSGIIYINCKLYNELNVINSCVNFYNNCNDIEYVDQSCFCYLVNFKYKEYSIIHSNIHNNININVYDSKNLINISFDNEGNISYLDHGIYHMYGNSYVKQIVDELYKFINRN